MKTKKETTEELLENLNPPNVEVKSHQDAFRLTILSTKKSAYISIVFLVLPILFLTGVIFKHYLQLEIGFLTSVYEWIGSIDQKYGDHSILNWTIRLALLFGPIIAILMNFLSILHIRYEKQHKEIVLSIKLKWLNWLIIIACKLVFLVFIVYLILENIR